MTQNITPQEDGTTTPFVMELYAQKARLLLTGAQELLSSGMAGVIQVAFTFSEDWQGLQKTAVFSNGTVSVDVPEEDWAETICTVPQQVLAAAGKTLLVGVYGTDGGKRVLPTVWCALGRIESGAAPTGMDALPPEAPLWARLQKQLGEVAATNPLVVRGLSMTSREDGSVILGLNQHFEGIETAAQAGRPVFLEVFGAVLPLTRLIAGSRAEFTGPVFTIEGRTYYHLCTLPSAGDAVVLTLPVGGTPAEDAIREALAQAKASGTFDGEPGPKGDKGDQGDPGEPGQPGSRILKIGNRTTYTYTTQRPNGFNPAYRIPLDGVLADANVTEVRIGDVIWKSYYHYCVGDVDGENAYLSAYVYLRGATGAAGADGAKGDKGDPGDDGYTPRKTVDYWTASDQEDIVQQVIAALGTPVFGTVDAENNIILTGALADGTYTLKYEDAEGNVTTIGTLYTEAAPTYTNILSLAVDSDGTPYNGGKGWKTGYRLNSSGTETAQTDIEVTGFIPVGRSDIIYFSGVSIPYDGVNADNQYFVLYNSSFTKIVGPKVNTDIGNYGAAKYDEANNLIELNVDLFMDYYGIETAKRDTVAYFRLSATEISSNSIITRNEPIA